MCLGINRLARNDLISLDWAVMKIGTLLLFGGSLDACQTGDQEVTGSILPDLATFFSGDGL